MLRDALVCQYVGQFLGEIDGIARGRQGTDTGMQQI